MNVILEPGESVKEKPIAFLNFFLRESTQPVDDSFALRTAF